MFLLFLKTHINNWTVPNVSLCSINKKYALYLRVELETIKGELATSNTRILPPHHLRESIHHPKKGICSSLRAYKRGAPRDFLIFCKKSFWILDNNLLKSVFRGKNV